jgi:signal-transduction protein with cAMP-binding, CBS, and nucleotidyltransferase domain
MIPVKQIMTVRVLKVRTGTPVQKAAEVMRKNAVGSLVVWDGRQIIGILTEGDITRRVVARGLNPTTTGVETVMTTPFLVIESNRSTMNANDIMEQEGVRHLGVIENGKIVGILSVRDLLRHVYGGAPK